MTSLDQKNLDILRDMRDSLVENSKGREQRRRKAERWIAFDEVSQRISTACETQDLTELVSHVRKMKNLLRRPSVRKDLARLEDKEPKKEIDGVCKCAQCGKTIDGSEGPCVEGALCVKCAMKKRVEAPGEKDQEKAKKKAEKGIAFPPEMMGMQGGGGMVGGGEPAGGEPEQDAAMPEPKAEPEQQEKPKKKISKKKKEKKDKGKEIGKMEKRPRIESRLRRRDFKRFGIEEEDFEL